MMRSFPQRTQQRIALLGGYFHQNVLAGAFICRHYHDCRESRSECSFFEGQLPHVGRHYDLEVNSRPMRIVFIGQEYGHGPAKVGLSARSDMIRNSAAQDFQSRRRNPHMKGTASTLRLLFGREPGTDAAGERLAVEPESHIFDGFALVNALLCSAVRQVNPIGEDFKGAAKGFSSPTMRRNCGAHLLRCLGILEPTLIVVQGQGVRKWIAPALNIAPRGAVSERIKIANRRVDMLTFDHPSAGGASGYWGGSPHSRYLREVVAPSIRSYLASTLPGPQ